MSLNKNSAIYQGLRSLKWKYINYFSDQGLATRRLRQYISQYDPLIAAKTRKAIYKQIKATADAKILNIAAQLEQKGYAWLNFSDLGIDSSNVLNYCDHLIKHFNDNQHDETYMSGLVQGKYAGKTICYEVYKKTDKPDPLLELARNPSLLAIASLYVKYLPILEYLGMVYNPVFDSDLFGSQLWHCDSQNPKMLKLFFYPQGVTAENGPFEFFPPSLSSLKYYRYSPQAMTDAQIEQFGLDVKCAIKFIAQPSQFLLVDVARCLHRGAVTKKPRYMSIISYCSPLYSFSSSAYRKTGTYQFAYQKCQAENKQLLEIYSQA